MNKWSRCTKCSAWLKPDATDCPRCTQNHVQHDYYDSYGRSRTYLPASGLQETVSCSSVDGSEAAIETEVLLQVLQEPHEGKTVQRKAKSSDVERECSICGCFFSGKSNRVNVCIECEPNDVVPLTGVMIIGGKNSMEIQINKDPELTRYMKRASTRHGTAPGIVTNKKGGTVTKIVTGLENRRHGDSK